MPKKPVKEDPPTHDASIRPRGYRVQQHIECCATCRFGGYLGYVTDRERMAICEIDGEVENSDYSGVAVEPLGKCDAYKPMLTTKFKGDEDDEDGEERQ